VCVGRSLHYKIYNQHKTHCHVQGKRKQENQASANCGELATSNGTPPQTPRPAYTGCGALAGGVNKTQTPPAPPPARLSMAGNRAQSERALLRPWL